MLAQGSRSLLTAAAVWQRACHAGPRAKLAPRDRAAVAPAAEQLPAPAGPRPGPRGRATSAPGAGRRAGDGADLSDLLREPRGRDRARARDGSCLAALVGAMHSMLCPV